MNNKNNFRLEHISVLPARIEQNVIYYSAEDCVAIHLCACGCGNQVVTMIEPTEWSLIDDLNNPSLHPSIGNWNFPCKSHYWIYNGKVKWAKEWTKEEIEYGRAYEQSVRDNFIETKEASWFNKVILSMIQYIKRFFE